MTRPRIILGTGGIALDFLDVVEAVNARAPTRDLIGFVDHTREPGSEDHGVEVLSPLSPGGRAVEDHHCHPPPPQVGPPRRGRPRPGPRTRHRPSAGPGTGPARVGKLAHQHGRDGARPGTRVSPVACTRRIIGLSPSHALPPHHD